MIWLDTLCARTCATSRVQSLERIAVHLAYSRKLLLLAGPTVASRLWCCVELYTWAVLGGAVEDVEVVLVGKNASEHTQTVASFDAFHVMYTRALEPTSSGHGTLTGGDVPGSRTIGAAASSIAEEHSALSADGHEVAHRLQLVVERATVGVFNKTIRAYLPAVRKAVDAAAAARAARSSTPQFLGHNIESGKLT